MIKKIISGLILCLVPVLLLAQDAEDIIVPEGYDVEKIAELNRAVDPVGLTFDSAGNLIVASIAFMILKIDQAGNEEIICQTGRLNIGPYDVEIAPDGNYIVLSGDLIDPYIKRIYKLVPPDDFTLLMQDHEYTSIAYDKAGNFYASFWDHPWPRNGGVIRYDSNFEDSDTVIEGLWLYYPSDMVFDDGNNMYLVERGGWGDVNGRLWKVPAGTDGKPGSEDTPVPLLSNLDYPSNITIDELGNLYVTVRGDSEIDGFSWYDKYNILKVNSETGDYVIFHSNLGESAELAFRDGLIYICETERCVISKIDISSQNKMDLTVDYGISSPHAIVLDSNDTLYTNDFRRRKLFRLNEDGTFDQVGQGLGYNQSIVSDDTYFYTGSLDEVGWNGRQILKIDPIAETVNVIGWDYDGFRGVAFDSYGRLILNTSLGGGNRGLSIIDLDTGDDTPYVEGLTSGKCIQFDPSQNFYVVEYSGGVFQGIKKVHLEEYYDPPLDISGEPLFYDFTQEPYPPSIGFFHVNYYEEVYIPRSETGQVIKGDKFGNTEVFAEGFLSPWYISFDQYGRMYVTDHGNGIFKITKPEWSVPLINMKLEDLIQDIQQSGIDTGTTTSLAKIKIASIDEGIKNSLCQKIKNAIKSLEKGNIKAAINKIKGFQNEVQAQRGKKIPIDLADSWLETSERIIKVLEDL